ncbi:de-hypoxanthine futalosine cyclase [Desulfonauticus submarinus]|uniref:Cyclic dehypoxanthine futalosine synthase n=1 Tax=Desulfonauticus submarinus TaxID=206665 RepID=A0A1H0DIF0_9BACT|nr:cyclic dehypoxanthinyl futalosine synthase [Desulfonauticus submarinus]SDN69884.1 de-hypoxanthine futalosine cyclase [Desulfonauticus submarinus]
MSRLTLKQALELWQEQDLFNLGKMAHKKRFELHPEPVVSYIVDRNINYTNICVSGCKFCAFYAPPNSKKGYVLSFDELAKKVEETVSLGGYQILLQGGMNPDLDLDFYKNMLLFLKKRFPSVWIHGFSPPEISFLAQKENISIKEVLLHLKEAGLDSIPGGGAEILVDRVRKKVSPRKCDASTWLKVMEDAHSLGFKTTATMMFGHVETFEERLEHLQRIRELQDKTGGFTAFIPWTFQPKNTLIDVPEVSSVEYLRFLALSRLFLDNVPNIQASWVTQGPKVGQMALFWGANDFGSTMIEENVVKATGVCFRLPEEKLREIIAGAGFVPKKRSMDYTLLE